MFLWLGGVGNRPTRIIDDKGLTTNGIDSVLIVLVISSDSHRLKLYNWFSGFPCVQSFANIYIYNYILIYIYILFFYQYIQITACMAFFCLQTTMYYFNPFFKCIQICVFFYLHTNMFFYVHAICFYNCIYCMWCRLQRAANLSARIESNATCKFWEPYHYHHTLHCIATSIIG